MLIDVAGHTAYVYTGGKTHAGGKAFTAGQPNLVFVHGAQHDHSVWALQSRYLAHHGFNVLAVDLPGHGRSKGSLLTSVEAMADWLLALLDAAGVARATLVGHSMGSLIALEATGRAPERVERLAMVGSAFPMKVSDVLLDAARGDEAGAFDMINVWSHLSLTHPPGSPAPGFSAFVSNRRLMERQAPGTLLNDFSACNAYAGGFERAGQVTCPTLFVLGRRDQMTPPKSGKKLATAIAGAQVIEVDASGHALMTEQPEAVLNALKAFVEPLRSKASA